MRNTSQSNSALWLLLAVVVLGVAVALVLWILGAAPETGRGAPRAPAGVDRPVVTEKPATEPTAQAQPVATDPATAASTDLAHITGRVTDEAGQPAAGVRVEAEPIQQGGSRSWRREGTTQTTSDASGRFDLPVSWPRVALSAQGNGWCGREGPITVREAGATGVDLVLESCARVAGRVMTVDEEPLEGARVRLFSTDADDAAEPRWKHFARETTTDASGAYELDAVPTGSIGLAADHPRGAPESRTLDVQAGARLQGVDFVLSPGLEIRGRVTEPDGTPVAGATARVWRAAPDAAGSRQDSFRVESDATGAFVVGGLDAGSYAFDLHHPDLYAEHRVIRRVQAGTHDLTVVLHRGGTLAGHVILEGGAAVPGASVWAGPGFAGGSEVNELERTPGAVSNVAAGIEGEFELRGVPPGTVGVYALTGGLRPSTITTLDLPTGGRVDGLVLTLRTGAVLQGRVIDQGGAPLGEVSVTAQLLRDGTPRGITTRTVTDGTGTFEFSGLEDGGVYQIDLRASGYTPEDPGALVTGVGSGEAITLVMVAGAILRGTVTGPDGAPTVAEVGLHLHDPIRQRLTRLYQFSTRSGADGTYLIDGVPAGRYVVAAERKGELVSEWRTVEVAAGELREGLDFALEAGGTITGVVVDDDDQPVAGVNVQARLVDGGETGEPAPDGGTIAHMKTGADGAFGFGGIRDALHQVSASPPDGYLHAAGGVSQEARPGESIVLRLSRGLVLRGEVVDDLGTPIREFTAITYSGSAGAISSIVEHRATAAEGVFELAGIDGRVVRLDITVEGYVPGAFPVEHCPESGVKDVGTLRLSRGTRLTGHVVDSGGRGIPGASVTATLADPEPDSLRELLGSRRRSQPPAKTNSQGAFELTGIEGGQTIVRVEHPDYRSQELPLEVPAAGEVAGVRIALDHGASLVGVVLGAGDQPLVGARLGAWGAGEAFQTSTGAGGRYRFDGLPAGNYRVSVFVGERDHDAGHGGTTILLDERSAQVVLGAEGEHRLDFPGFAASHVHGAVRGGAGTPGQVVRLSGSTGSFNCPVGADGGYELSGIPPGRYVITVNPSYRDRLDVPAGADLLHDIELPGAGLRGSVVGPAGAPAPGAGIRLSRSGDGGTTSTVSARANDEGAFELPALHSGPWTIVAQQEGVGRSREVQLILGDGVTEEVTLQLLSGVGLTVRALSPQGTPVPGASVVCQTMRGIQLGGARTGADGTVSIDGVTADRYVLYGHTPELGNTWSEPFDVDGAGAAVLDLRFSASVGRLRVRASQDGRPAAGARVTLSHGDGRPAVDMTHGFAQTSFTTNAEGVLETAAFPAGSYQVRVLSADLETTAEAEVSIQAEGMVELEVSLE